MKIDVTVVKPKPGDIPFTPFAELYVAESTRDQEGRTILSPRCVTSGELAYWCDNLIGQLQDIKKTKIG